MFSVSREGWVPLNSRLDPTLGFASRGSIARRCTDQGDAG